MVFLQHQRIKQRQSVIDAAANGHRVFLCHAQPRQGLAGVQNPGAGTAHGIHILRSDSGSARQGLQEVERGALGADQGAAAAVQRGDERAFGQPCAFVAVPINAHSGVEGAMGGVKPRPPRQHARFLAQQIRLLRAIVQ